MNIVSMTIAFLPGGLTTVLTTSLTIIANFTKRNHFMFISLEMVKTLGAVFVLCSGKTGTRANV